MYGGNGQTFALPDLRGRVVLHWGNGPGGLPSQSPGQRGGEVMHALTLNELPPHQHPLNTLNTFTGRPSESSAAGNLLPAHEEHGFVRLETGKPTALHGMSVGPTGTGAPHNVMPPYLTITFCIVSLPGARRASCVSVLPSARSGGNDPHELPVIEAAVL
jgi:microcystin-dependent protein